MRETPPPTPAWSEVDLRERYSLRKPVRMDQVRAPDGKPPDEVSSKPLVEASPPA